MHYNMKTGYIFFRSLYCVVKNSALITLPYYKILAYEHNKFQIDCDKISFIMED